MIITKLGEVEIHDLAELVQISSVISLTMDDLTDLKQDVMVSQLINLSINQFLNVNARDEVALNMRARDQPNSAFI